MSAAKVWHSFYGSHKLTQPPPNQVVFVTSTEGIASQGRVTFVKVMGRIEAKESQHSRQDEFSIQKFNAAYAMAKARFAAIEKPRKSTATVDRKN